jgi:hypothetical protein
MKKHEKSKKNEKIASYTDSMHCILSARATGSAWARELGAGGCQKPLCARKLGFRQETVSERVLSEGCPSSARACDDARFLIFFETSKNHN